MSLKIEQRLDNFFFSEAEPKIYTTGAHLVPMKIMKGKEERYVWVVYEFDDDSYIDGELCSPTVYADSLEHLKKFR
ncbi:MAG: hypothetical protein HY752_06165 [Nitrospirae bacterium]|nr:hypothetical protein [Nitrospirota bacterium]